MFLFKGALLVNPRHAFALTPVCDAEIRKILMIGSENFYANAAGQIPTPEKLRSASHQDLNKSESIFQRSVGANLILVR